MLIPNAGYQTNMYLKCLFGPMKCLLRALWPKNVIGGPSMARRVSILVLSSSQGGGAALDYRGSTRRLLNSPEEPKGEIEILRERISHVGVVSLRIDLSLDLGTVLREVVENTRALTVARYGVIAAPGDNAARPPKSSMRVRSTAAWEDRPTHEVCAWSLGISRLRGSSTWRTRNVL